MKTLVKAGVTLAIGVASVLGMAGPASAASYATVMDNQTLAHGFCSGDISMNYFYTKQSGVTKATYYDQYQNSAGTWLNGGRSYTLDDAASGNFLMITNLIGSPVRVRADHYVYTRQGPNCSQR